MSRTRLGGIVKTFPAIETGVDLSCLAQSIKELETVLKAMRVMLAASIHERHRGVAPLIEIVPEKSSRVVAETSPLMESVSQG